MNRAAGGVPPARGSSIPATPPPTHLLEEAAFAAFAELPVAVLLRARGGRLLRANAAARRLFGLDAARAPGDSGREEAEIRITRIRRARDGGPCLFLLSAGARPKQRFAAHCRPFGAAGPSCELLVPETGDRERTARSARLLARLESRMHRARRAAAAPTQRRAPQEPRPLLAGLLRRIRRHLPAPRPFRLLREIAPPAADRVVNADPVAVAQVVLSTLDLLAADMQGGTLRLAAAEVGCRLRLVLDGRSLTGKPAGIDLRHRPALARELAPILESHGATLEIHRSAGAGRVILTLPTLPAGAVLDVDPGDRNLLR